MKKVKNSELNTLLRQCFTNAYRKYGLEYHEISFDLMINSIYSELTFSFKQHSLASINKANGIVEEFTKNLKEYVGNNIAVISKIATSNKEEPYKLILQIDYDIIE